MLKTLHYFSRFLLYLLLVLIPIIAYIYLYNIAVDASNGHTYLQVYLELPLLVMILFLLYIPYKSLFKNAFLAFLPLLSLYIVYDIFYYFLKRSARLSDFSNIVMLNDFSFLMMLGMIFFVFLTIIPISLLFLGFRTKNYRKNRALLLSKLFMMGSLFFLFFTNNNYLIKNFNYINYSQAKTIKYNGRFASFIYYDCMSHISAQKVISYQKKDVNISQILFPNKNLHKKRNIHLIVLESFVDPRLFKNISYNRSPLSNSLKKYLGKEGFSYLKSPIYGGGTAQAEFEILTGIRAFGKIDSVDFNTLRGEKMSGFIDSLSEQGYSNYASIATSSEYFNSIAAYGSIGLKHLQFLEETPSYSIRKGDAHIFDGDLFDYNIKRIKSFPKNKPYLLYTLGMYGHIPYQRNKVRPSIIFPSTKDHRVKRIANQFYYRTKALAKYIDEILTIDPHAIIYISSDHLPSILNAGIKYKKERKINIALLLIDGKNVPINGLRFYQVPRYLWHYLNDTHTEFKDNHSREEEKNVYFKALSQSLNHD